MITTKSLVHSLKSFPVVGDPVVTVHWVSMLVVQPWNKSMPIKVTFLSTFTDSGVVSVVGVVMDTGVVAGGVVASSDDGVADGVAMVVSACNS